MTPSTNSCSKPVVVTFDQLKVTLYTINGNLVKTGTAAGISGNAAIYGGQALDLDFVGCHGLLLSVMKWDFVTAKLGVQGFR